MEVGSLILVDLRPVLVVGQRASRVVLGLDVCCFRGTLQSQDTTSNHHRAGAGQRPQ